MPKEDNISAEDQGAIVAVLSSCIKLAASRDIEDARRMYSACIDEISTTGNLACESLVVTGKALYEAKQVLCSGEVSIQQLKTCFVGPAEKISEVLSSSSAEILLSREFWLTVDLLRQMKDAQTFAIDHMATPLASAITKIPNFLINPALKNVTGNIEEKVGDYEMTDLHRMLLVLAVVAYVFYPLLNKLANHSGRLDVVKSGLHEELKVLDVTDDLSVSKRNDDISEERINRNKASAQEMRAEGAKRSCSTREKEDLKALSDLSPRNHKKYSK